MMINTTSATTDQKVPTHEAKYCSFGDAVHYVGPSKIFRHAEGRYIYDSENDPRLMHKLSATMGLVAALFLSGCVSVPKADDATDAQAKLFLPTKDKASLYIYRNERLGRAVKMAVLVDGTPVGKTVAERYIHLTLPAGKHVIESSAENHVALSINTRAGETYFVWQEVKRGFVWSRSALHVVDAHKGQVGVRACTLIRTTSP